MNKVLLIGRLGRDPEQRSMMNGSPVVTLRIATTESYTDRSGNRVEQTEWHRVVTFQKMAEQCARYLTKGRLVYVEGKLQTRKWQDDQGQDRTMTEIRADVVRFLDTAGDRGGQPVVSGHNQTLHPSESKITEGNHRGVSVSTMDDIPF